MTMETMIQLQLPLWTMKQNDREKNWNKQIKEPSPLTTEDRDTFEMIYFGYRELAFHLVRDCVRAIKRSKSRETLEPHGVWLLTEGLELIKLSGYRIEPETVKNFVRDHWERTSEEEMKKAANDQKMSKNRKKEGKK